jgi:cell division transport system permease protein
LGRWWLFFKEGFLILHRNRTPWFVAQVMMILAVGATGLLIGTASHLDALEAKVISGFPMEAFLDITSDSTAVEAFSQRLSELPQIDHIQFVSREEAAQRFQEALGVDLRGTLDENPLPPSLKISIGSNCSAETLDSLAVTITTFEYCDEVVYPKELIQSLSAIRLKVRSNGLLVVIAIALIAFALTAFVIRQSLRFDHDKIHVMSLLGASRAMIRVPFVLAGLTLGAVGGIIASAAVSAIMIGAGYYFQLDVNQGWIGGLLMILGGIAWGILASLVAILWGTRSL